jgi:hypothetical protein
MMASSTDAGAFLTKYDGKDLWMVESHAGLVLNTYERNGYDDSDFYATVWNDEKGMPEHVMYASTRGWTYPNGAAVDATDEVKAKYEAYMAALRAEYAADKAAAEAAKPKAGRKAKTVRNVKGKHAIEAGVTGTIFWVGVDRFARNYGGRASMRVGFAPDDGRDKVFLAENAVEVLAA